MSGLRPLWSDTRDIVALGGTFDLAAAEFGTLYVPIPLSAHQALTIEITWQSVNGDATLFLQWAAEPTQAVSSLWEETIPLPRAQQVRIRTPRRGPYCDLVVVANPGANGTVVMRVEGLDVAPPATEYVISSGGAEQPRLNLSAPADLRVAYPGRVRVHFGTDGVNTLTTSGVVNTEAAATLRVQRGAAAAAAASNYTVPAGKRLRLQGGHLVVAHSAAGAVWFAIRLTTALTGNQLWYAASRAQAAASLVVPITIPDGFEFGAGEVLQFSTRATVASQVLELELWGFEYDAT